RLAVLGGDEATVARVQGRMQVGAGWVSTVLQRLLLELWTDSSVTALVERARGEYEALRAGLVGALAARGVAAQGRTGINVWVPVGDETLVVTRLRDEGYAVAPGALFRIRSAPGVRITVGPLDTGAVGALADAVARAVTGSAGTHLSA
ncbi:MAG TPA: GntR family transcriptional regulator, partial [Rugosimonospora sp.]|nr:GntR family transcriptional regulator [Rugosimonospora sp.]